MGLAPQLETAFAQHAANLDAMNKKTGETDASFARWKETLNGLKDTTANMLDNLGTQGGNLFAPAAAEGLRQLNDVLKLLSDNFDTVASGAVVLGSGIAGMTAAKKLAANETARYAAETIKLEAAQLRGKVTLLGSAQAVAMKAQADTEAALPPVTPPARNWSALKPNGAARWPCKTARITPSSAPRRIASNLP